MVSIRKLIDSSASALAESDDVAHVLSATSEAGAGNVPSGGRQGRTVPDSLLSDVDDRKGSLRHIGGHTPVSVGPDAHVFEVSRILVAHGLGAVPAVDEDGRYLGLVRRADVFEELARMLCTCESGAVVTVDLRGGETSISKLVYAVEQTGVKLLSVTRQWDDGKMIGVALKLDRCDIGRLCPTLQYYGYRVMDSFGEEHDPQLLQRVQEFIRFLEV